MKAIFFDFDGVIIDSEPLMRYAFSKSYSIHYGDTSKCPIEEYLSHSGDAFNRIMQRLGLSKDLYPDFKRISTENIDMIKIFPHITEFLIFCKKAKMKTALITGKDSARTIQILNRFNIYQYFDLLVCSDMVKQPKPNPESIITALDKLQVKANETFMIGDSLYDMIAAKRAGVKSIGVLWGIVRNDQLFKELNVDYIIKTPQELYSIIEKQ